MNISVEKSFDNDVNKIKDQKVLSKLRDIIIQIDNSGSIGDIPQIRKLKGYDSFYRIKVGDYRIGLEKITTDSIALIRCLHRKDIYRYFPRK